MAEYICFRIMSIDDYDKVYTLWMSCRNMGFNNLEGFLMIGFDADDYWVDAPRIAKGNYNLWRLMIDEDYQNMGYGREAVRLALVFIESFPCGKAEYCWLSYEPDNEIARRLYRSFGFEETGEMDGEELIAVRKIGENHDRIECDIQMQTRYER